jgi:hypothetical protein
LRRGQLLVALRVALVDECLEHANRRRRVAVADVRQCRLDRRDKGGRDTRLEVVAGDGGDDGRELLARGLQLDKVLPIVKTKISRN